MIDLIFFFFFSSRRRHTRWTGDWSSDVCSSDLLLVQPLESLRGQLAPSLGIERLLVVSDRLEEIARGVEIAEGREVRLEALHGVGGVPGAVDERVVEGVPELRSGRPLVVLRPL